MNSRITYLKTLLNTINSDLRKLPEGKLRISRSGNRIQYYLRKDPSDSRGKYLRKNQTHIAAGIAQKEYLTKLKSAVEEELDMLCLYEQINSKHIPPEAVPDTLTPDRRALISPLTISDTEYIHKWQSQQYPQMRINYNNQDYITTLNESVRSKSEYMIAECLHSANIPYLYEKPLDLDRITVHPDYTILRISDRKELYWEHLGKMDDPDYSEKAVEKIKLYEKSGFFLGDDLIITMETSSSPLTPSIIRDTINHYIRNCSA